MDLFNRERLRDLAHQHDDVCISLYMPTFRFESDWSQNPTRFKNLVREARDQLREQGYRDDEIERILEDAHRRLDDSAFWRSMSDGLAVFIKADSADYYRLPLSFDEIAIVGRRFHLKPLFPLIATNNRFYVLALSQNDVKLYQGTHQAVSEIEASSIPADIVEAIQQYEDPEQQIQWHIQKQEPQGDGRRMDAAFHGQGVTSDDLSSEPQDELKRFFRKVDEGVCERLSGEDAPLVLAGVAEYLPLYRSVNNYAHLIEDDIAAGNPESLSPKELHERVWGIVEPVFLEAQDDAMARFEQLFYQDGDLASEDVNEVIPACAFSRVDTLFVPIGRHLWGTFDPEENTVEIHDTYESGDEDLLDYAAVNAYKNGATVYALHPENMPGGRNVAATFRFVADVSAQENG